MYSGAGAATITNYGRAIVTVDPVGDSTTFAWRVAKRFRESGWPLSVQHYKWNVLESGCRLWVPASVAESSEAKRTSGKTFQDFYNLVPATFEPIPKDSLERIALGTIRASHVASIEVFSQTLSMGAPPTHCVCTNGKFTIQKEATMSRSAENHSPTMRNPRQSKPGLKSRNWLNPRS